MTASVLALALVAFGSALGGMARFAVSGFVARWTGERFPWGTVLVNISGSFLIGLFAAMTASDGLLPGNMEAKALLVTGICGGYTTFSSFALQTLNLARDRAWTRAVGNVIASALLCFAATWLGLACAVSLGW